MKADELKEELEAAAGRSFKTGNKAREGPYLEFGGAEKMQNNGKSHSRPGLSQVG